MKKQVGFSDVWQLFLPVVYYMLFQGIFQMAVKAILGEKVCMEHTAFVQAIGNLLAVPVLLAACGSRERERKEQKTVRPSLKACLLILGTSICFSRGCNLLISLSLLPKWFPAYESVSQSLLAENIWVQAFAVVAASPIAEELLMRGILYERMKRLTGNIKWSILGNALLFALFHGNLVQGIYAFCLGLLFAWLKEKYESLWAPILAHAAANGVSLFRSIREMPDLFGGHPAGQLFLTAAFFLIGYGLVKQIQVSEGKINGKLCENVGDKNQKRKNTKTI